MDSGYLTLGRQRVWTVPWRMVGVLRARRSIDPVPRTYLLAALVGVGLGVGADLMLGWPWWLVAPAFVVAVALFFLSSAFWPRGRYHIPLSTELLRVVSPRRARERDHREMIKRVRSAPFPLYGLPPTWSGARFLSSWGGGWTRGVRGLTTALGLAHGDPTAPGGPHLQVEVDDNPVPADGHRHLLAMEFGDRVWSTTTVRLDGRPITVELADGDEWVGYTVLEDHTVVLRGRGLRVASVELVTITDLEPYVEGYRGGKQYGQP